MYSNVAVLCFAYKYLIALVGFGARNFQRSQITILTQNTKRTIVDDFCQRIAPIGLLFGCYGM